MQSKGTEKHMKKQKELREIGDSDLKPGIDLSSNLYSAYVTTKHKSCQPVNSNIESVPPANNTR